MTLEQKEKVRGWFAHTVETLPVEIEQEIERIGGEEMLLQRIDVLKWVYFTRDDVRMYQEVLRFLDGEDDIDESLIRAAIQQEKCNYQNAITEIAKLKQTIREAEERLALLEERLPQYALSVEILEENMKGDDQK